MSLKELLEANIGYGAKLVSVAYEFLHNADLQELLGNDRHGYISDTQVSVSSGDIAKDARKFLPLVEKWDKSVNDYSGQLEVTGKLKGSNFSLRLYGDLPETCHVEVEEQIVVVPEHKEVQRKFKMVGDCLPLLGNAQEEKQPSSL